MTIKEKLVDYYDENRGKLGFLLGVSTTLFLFSQSLKSRVTAITTQQIQEHGVLQEVTKEHGQKDTVLVIRLSAFFNTAIKRMVENNTITVQPAIKVTTASSTKVYGRIDKSK